MGLIVGMAIAGAIFAGIVFRIRYSLPMGPIVVLLGFVQVVGAANSSYTIAWPAAFNSLVAMLKVFLLQVVTVLRAECASSMTYYDSMLVTLLLFVALISAVMAFMTWSRVQLEQKRFAKSQSGLRHRTTWQALRLLAWSRPLKPTTLVAGVCYPGKPPSTAITKAGGCVAFANSSFCSVLSPQASAPL